MPEIQLTYGTKEEASIVSLAIAKMNSKIECSDEDDLYQLYLDAATDEIENYLDFPVIKRVDSTLKINEWIEKFKFPFPVANVSALAYETGFGTTQDIASENWIFENGVLILDLDEPEDLSGSLVVTLDVGYETTAIPSDIKAAALLMFSHADTYREDRQMKLSTASHHKLRPYKIAW